MSPDVNGLIIVGGFVLTAVLPRLLDLFDRSRRLGAGEAGLALKIDALCADVRELRVALEGSREDRQKIQLEIADLRGELRGDQRSAREHLQRMEADVRSFRDELKAQEGRHEADMLRITGLAALRGGNTGGVR